MNHYDNPNPSLPGSGLFRPLALVCLLLLAAAAELHATGFGAGAPQGSALRLRQSAPAPRRLHPPLPPDTLGYGEQLLYVVEHWWDSFDFGDTAWLADSAAYEQAFADWAYIAGFLSDEYVSRSTGYVVARADVSRPMLLRFAQAAEHYFGSADSPYRNEEALIPILEALTTARHAEPAERERFAALLAAADRNRPGRQAAELHGQAADGRRVALSSLACDYTLLLFYSPSCSSCTFVKHQIEVSTAIGPLMQQGKLRVYALYPGSDDEEWRRTLGQMPSEGWTVVCDPDGSVTDEGRYALGTLPTLYLLGRERRVLLKDAALEKIEQWLHEYAGPMSYKLPVP